MQDKRRGHGLPPPPRDKTKIYFLLKQRPCYGPVTPSLFISTAVHIFFFFFFVDFYKTLRHLDIDNDYEGYLIKTR